jgi:hypothetical protein
MKLIKTFTGVAAASLLVCAIPQSASAALVALSGAAISPLTAQSLAGDTIVIATALGTAVPLASQTIPGMNSGVWTANFSAQAYYNLDSSGPITFVYTITQLTGATTGNPITGFNIASFLGAGTINVGSVGAVAGLSVFSATGNTLDFAFSPLANGGSATIVVQTGSSTWGFGPGTISDSQSVNFQSLSVPEPTTMIAGALLLLPFGASTLRFVRKNRLA